MKLKNYEGSYPVIYPLDDAPATCSCGAQKGVFPYVKYTVFLEPGKRGHEQWGPAPSGKKEGETRTARRTGLLKWTTEKPTVSGLYWIWWHRSGASHYNLVSVDIENDEVCWFGRENTNNLEDAFALKWCHEQEFYGPIASHAPPSREP